MDKILSGSTLGPKINNTESHVYNTLNRPSIEPNLPKQSEINPQHERLKYTESVTVPSMKF